MVLKKGPLVPSNKRVFPLSESDLSYYCRVAGISNDSAFHGFQTKLNLSVGPGTLILVDFRFTAYGESQR